MTVEDRTVRKLMIEPQNPLELTDDELSVLAISLVQLFQQESYEPQIEVVVTSEEPHGVANNLWEILHIFLPSTQFVKDAIWTKFCDRVLGFMRSRFRKPHESARPRITYIYGPHGEILKTVVLRGDKEDPEWFDEGEDRPPPPMS